MPPPPSPLDILTLYGRKIYDHFMSLPPPWINPVSAHVQPKKVFYILYFYSKVYNPLRPCLHAQKQT